MKRTISRQPTENFLLWKILSQIPRG
jgi:hypothetical protein